MPKRGTIECPYLDCVFSLTGELPDHKDLGKYYFYLLNEGGDFPAHLALKLIQHHEDTRKVSEADQVTHISRGHNYYVVHLKDGGRGEVDVNSSAVKYCETEQ